MEQNQAEQQQYESWVNDNFFMPLLKSRSGRYQVKAGLVDTNYIYFKKYANGQQEKRYESKG